MIYTIPEYRSSKLIKRLEKMNRKAVKFSANPIIYTVSPVYSKTFSKQSDRISLQSAPDYETIYFEVNVVDIEIDTESFKPIKGYKFLCSIEHTENGNLYSKVSPDVEIPEQYRTTKSGCEHCKIERFRRNTYIILDEQKKSFIQVGSTCIKDYLGIPVDLIAKRFELLHEMTELSDPDRQGYFDYAEPTYDILTFLSVALRVIEKCGFVSGKVAWDSQGAKTATGHETIRVFDYRQKPTDSQEYKDYIRYCFSYTKDQEAEAQKIIDYFVSLTPDNDFLHNISVIVKNGYLKHKNANHVAAMIPVYMKAMDLLKPKDTRVSNWVGQIKEKINLNVTVKYERKTEGFSYGYSKYGPPMVQVLTLKDENANIFTWFNNSKTDYVVGDVLKGKATVKKHTEYKGIKQTVITRAKFEIIENVSK